MAIGHTKIKDGRIGVQNRTFEVRNGRVVLDGATPEHIAYMLAHPSFTELPDPTETAPAAPVVAPPPAADPKDAEIATWKANAEQAKAAAIALAAERDDAKAKAAALAAERDEWQELAKGSEAELATLRAELDTLRAAAADPKTPDTEAAPKRTPRGK